MLPTWTRRQMLSSSEETKTGTPILFWSLCILEDTALMEDCHGYFQDAIILEIFILMETLRGWVTQLGLLFWLRIVSTIWSLCGSTLPPTCLWIVSGKILTEKDWYNICILGGFWMSVPTLATLDGWFIWENIQEEQGETIFYNYLREGIRKTGMLT